MPHVIGTRLGPYEVVALIGSGGMGEVYRARDTKLGRDVALKILPDLYAQEPDRIARFGREAQVLASLNHPNIAAIYGLEESGGVRALVLELVDGPTLGDRLKDVGRTLSGPPKGLPLDEVLSIARQIADALGAAHEKGITHRDLKPANVKITPAGMVKVLDFGLAKIRLGDAGSAALSNAPTMLTVMSMPGTILGTAAYMSPEQAKGRETDRRTDIWAFGCVLYEMLTGQAAFAKDNVADTLAAVLGREPDWTMLGPHLPAALRLLVQRCLEKDPQRRIGDISTAIFLMNEPAMAAPAADPAVAIAPVRGSGVWLRVAVVVAVLAAAVGGAAAVWFETRPAPRRVARLPIAASGTSALSVTGFPGRDVAISPDGAHIVYVGDNGRRLFVRTLDQLDPVPLVGADFPLGLFFSYDGKWIGFVGEFLLKKAAINGGAVQSLSKLGARTIRGATWGENGTIIFATDELSTGLEQLSEGAEATTVLTHPNLDRGEVDHVWPEFLPGGEAVLFTILDAGGIDNAQVAVLDLKTGAQKILFRGGSAARYVPSGHLVYGAAGTLRAVAFDLERLEVLGTAVPVVPQVLTMPTGSAEFDLTSDGTLVYVRGGLQASPRTLVWVDRQGREEAIQMPARAYQYLRLSPDGTRVAIDVRDQESDIWLWEFARRTLTRFTFDAAPDRFPVWTADGRRVLFTSSRTGTRNVFSQASDGTGTPEQLTQNKSAGDTVPTGVSPDGAWVILRDGAAQGFDVTRLSLSNDHRVEPLVHTAFSEQNGEVSPDGRWLAYQSNDSGRAEIWVRPFPDVNGGRWQVSPGGGFQPLWGPDGRELFYRDSTAAVMRVGIERGPGWAATTPTRMFAAGQYFFGAGEAFGRGYDISRDGRRFLMIKDVTPDPSSAPTIVVVQNWFEELRQKVPTSR